MTDWDLCALLLSGGMFFYLIVALLRPEDFS